jgi:hypothetical protein
MREVAVRHWAATTMVLAALPACRAFLRPAPFRARAPASFLSSLRTTRLAAEPLEGHKERVYGLHDRLGAPQGNVTRAVHNEKQAAGGSVCGLKVACVACVVDTRVVHRRGGAREGGSSGGREGVMPTDVMHLGELQYSTSRRAFSRARRPRRRRWSRA